jgi:uncharacterized protein YndB with AHSA1/START domain
MTDVRITKSVDAEPVAATLAQVEGRWVITMTRELAYPPERVWRMLTEPERLARWSPVVPDRILDSPGPAQSRESPDAPPVDLEVLVTDAPRELVHRWGTHTLQWTLTPTDTGTRLVLAETLDEYAEASRNGAGWHLCLAVLAAYFADDTVDRVVGPDADAYGWSDLRDRYEELFAAARH